MTRKTYVCWTDVLNETDEICEKLADLVRTGQAGIDHAHWVAERIRQLGRDMEAPSGPVIHEPKEKSSLENTIEYARRKLIHWDALLDDGHQQATIIIRCDRHHLRRLIGASERWLRANPPKP